MGAVAACVSGALAFPAAAEVTVGGFMTQTVGLGNYKEGEKSKESVHFDTNAEVLFTATGQTDGGLTVTARVELEGHSGGDQIDENWLSVEGGFGKLTLGGKDSAVITHGYAGIAGGYGIMGYYDDTDSFTPIGANIGPVGYTDAQGIRYSSPNFGGFSAGVSYQPEFADGPRATSKDNDDRAVSAAANFSTDIGSAHFTIAGGILAFDDSYNTGNSIGGGVELGMGSTTLFIRGDNVRDQGISQRDSKNWAVAIEYQSGPLTLGVGYAERDVEIERDSTVEELKKDGYVSEESALADEFTFTHLERSGSALVAGARYSLGGGVTVGGALAWGQLDSGRIEFVTAPTQATALTDTFSEDDSASFGAHIAFSF